MVKPFKTKLISAFILLLLFGYSGEIKAQSHTYGKNVVYLSYGNIIFSDQASISYERLLLGKKKLKTLAKLNYGKYLGQHADYENGAKVYQNYLSLSGTQLIGWFEINGGVGLVQYNLAPGLNPDPNIDYSKNRREFILYGNLGYRYMKNHLLFRAGIGNMELLYLSIGFTF